VEVATCHDEPIFGIDLCKFVEIDLLGGRATS
jgi:hypothetical protein